MAFDQAISTLDQAVWWLWENSPVENYLEPFESMPLEAKLVCQVYWCTEAQLREKLKAAWREMRW